MARLLHSAHSKLNHTAFLHRLLLPLTSPLTTRLCSLANRRGMRTPSSTPPLTTSPFPPAPLPPPPTPSTVSADSEHCFVPKWRPCFTPGVPPPVEHPGHCSETPPFRIISFNILAQVYVKKELFPASPPQCLKWKARSAALKGLLVALDADILCLQELDEYETTYSPFLASRGYTSVYVKRPGGKKDGAGVFFRASRLELVGCGLIDYNDLARQLLQQQHQTQPPHAPRAVAGYAQSAAGATRGPTGNCTPASGLTPFPSSQSGASTRVELSQGQPRQSTDAQSQERVPLGAASSSRKELRTALPCTAEPSEAQTGARVSGAVPASLDCAAKVLFTAAAEGDGDAAMAVEYEATQLGGRRGVVDKSARAGTGETGNRATDWCCEGGSKGDGTEGREGAPAEKGVPITVSVLADASQAQSLSLELQGLAMPSSDRGADEGAAGQGCTQQGGTLAGVVRYTRDCVGLVCALRPVVAPGALAHAQESGRAEMLFVACTHLYWDPAYADVKLAQAQHLVACTTQFRSAVCGKLGLSPDSCPLITGGDFNSLPGDPVYNFMTNGSQQEAWESRGSGAAQASQLKALNSHAALSTELGARPSAFQSVYFAGDGREPDVTNHSPGFSGTLDYLFCDKAEHLRVQSLLDVPRFEAVKEHSAGLPTGSHPSDHLPVGAELQIM